MAIAQIQNDPIYSLPFQYISGLDLSIASTKVIAIAPGQARDSNDILDMPVGYQDIQGTTSPETLFSGYRQPLLVNTAVVGVNGLDAGALAASSQYAIYLIADSRGYKKEAGIMTLSSNAHPLLPFGYDSLRLLGFVSTNASTNFVFSTNKPQMMKSAKTYILAPAAAGLSAGTSTTFATVDLNAAIPLATLPNVIATLAVTFIPVSAGSLAKFRPSGSTATTGLVTISAVAAGVAQTQYIQVICGVDTSKTGIDYLVSSASDSLSFSVVSYTGVPLEAYPA